MAYTVYCHENKSNGKLYFGITKTSTRRRWSKGKGYKTQHVFGRAIEKYGWDGFEHIILYTGLSEAEAKQMETDLIREFNTQDGRYGYNITAGGDDVPIIRGTDNPKARAIIVFDLDGNPCGEFGVGSEAAKFLGVNPSSIVGAIKRNGTIANHFCMYKDECDNPQKQPPRKRLNMSARFKPVSQYDLDGTYIQSFGSIVEASEKTGIKRADISAVVAGRQHEAHGFQFRYDDGSRDNIERAPKRGEANRGSNHYDAKAVELYNVHTGEVLKRHGSITGAAIAEGVPRSQIQNDCLNTYKSKRDYRWRYANDT